jgi:GH43 family beta-xylosidase
MAGAASILPSPFAGVAAPGTFTNPLFRGADPFVARHDGWYYYCQSGPGNRLEVYKSGTPIDRGDCRVVWAPPRSGWNRAQVWAPELHRLGSRWYLYYSASDGRNANHRVGVLAATTDDPRGPYEDAGQLYTGDDLHSRSRNRWAIDGTVFTLRSKLYFLWSGWEADDDIQHLYVARMSDPTTVATSRVRICPNDCHPWERVGERHWERGLHEGPQVLIRHGRVLIVYSCSGSWQPTYKLGMLYMDEHRDPLDPGAWTKFPTPVFESTREVFGVGHCCFTLSPDGTEDWMLYHSKRNRRDCWQREIRAQRFTWTEDGFPDFDRPAASGLPLPLPSDQAPARRVA